MVCENETCLAQDMYLGWKADSAMERHWQVLNFLHVPFPFFQKPNLFCASYCQSALIHEIRKMFHSRSTLIALANSTLIQPVKLSYGMASSTDPPCLCSYTALVISTVLLSGVLGGAVKVMAYLLLFGKCSKGRKSMQNDIKELKSRHGKLPQSERQNPYSRVVYCPKEASIFGLDPLESWL